MSEPAKPTWGSEIDFGAEKRSAIVQPIATSEGYDLAGDQEVQDKLHPPADLARTAPTSPLGRLMLCEYGAGAAGVLAAVNLMGLFDVDKRPLDSLIGPDPSIYVYAQLGAAALAVALAVLILTRHGLWACEAVLLWCLVELYPPLTRAVYGHAWHGKEFRMVLAALGLAIGGVSGAWAVRRAGPQPALHKPVGTLQAMSSGEG